LEVASTNFCNYIQTPHVLTMKLPGIIFFIWFTPLLVNAQKFTAKWYGRAETKTRSSYNSYLIEIVVIKKGNKFTGTLNYFFGQQEHVVKISGIYWPKTRTIELNPFKLITHFATNQNSPDCLVDGSLTLYTDSGDSVLYGQINPVEKYRNMCPILTISLNKEVMTELVPDDDLAVAVDSTEKIVAQRSTDTVQNTQVISSVQEKPAGAPVIIAAIVPPLTKEEKKAELTKRTFEEGPLIQSDSDTITIHLYDNGTVDNDSVSVFFNRDPVIVKQKLSVTPIVVKLVLQPGENEIAMFAENLGDIPPNTALCLIFAAGKRYDINLTSTMASNGTVRIKRRE